MKERKGTGLNNSYGLTEPEKKLKIANFIVDVLSNEITLHRMKLISAGICFLLLLSDAVDEFNAETLFRLISNTLAVLVVSFGKVCKITGDEA